MSSLLDNMLLYLKVSHYAIGFPLVVAGVGLMLFGWRLWKVCVVLAFAVLGAAATAHYVGPGDYQWQYAIGGGVILGLASAWPVNIAVAILGGLIGATVMTVSLSNLGLSDAALWGAAAVAMIGCTAFAFTNRQRVVVLVTSFLGAVLLLGGLTAWVMAMPGLYGTFKMMASYSSIVVPFLLIVPTVMAVFYQVAEIRRLHADI